MRGLLAIGRLVGHPLTGLDRTQRAKVIAVLKSVRVVNQVQCSQFGSEPSLPRYTPHTRPIALQDMGMVTGNMGTIAR